MRAGPRACRPLSPAGSASTRPQPFSSRQLTRLSSLSSIHFPLPPHVQHVGPRGARMCIDGWHAARLVSHASTVPAKLASSDLTTGRQGRPGSRLARQARRCTSNQGQTGIVRPSMMQARCLVTEPVRATLVRRTAVLGSCQGSYLPLRHNRASRSRRMVRPRRS